MQKLNRQLAAYRDRLCSDVGLNSDEASKVATLVGADIRFLSPEVKSEIKAASPVPISARLDELVAFQAWMDLASSIPKQPAITRTQVVVQKYVCFVYLKDACFEVVAKRAAPNSVAARCSNYLSRARCVISVMRFPMPTGNTTQRSRGLNAGCSKMRGTD